LFNVAASRPAQMTTEQPKASGLSGFRQAEAPINQNEALRSQAK
jgi:hypothetical protein